MLKPESDRDGAPGRAPAVEHTRSPSVDGPGVDGVLVARGALDFGFVADLRAALDAALADRPPRLTLDVTGVWLLDAGTLRLLLVFQRQAAAEGCVFRVVGAGGLVRRVFEITDTLKLLE